ncbi:MAG: patatin-like phospholipase family protein [bacterium]
MGITIVQKSDQRARKRNPKVALVLAGGAVTGGAFKLGGLKALDDLLVNRKTTDFDSYIGLSAGAVLAAPLAAGVAPAEMIKSLEGNSDELDRFRARDFYSPNFVEFFERPLRYTVALLTFLPGSVADVLRNTPKLATDLQAAVGDFVRGPSPWKLSSLLAPLADAIWTHRSFPSLLDHLPSGMFDNASIERYIRRNLQRAGLSNDFRALYRRTHRELYISAMNLDTAERVVFGHDEDASVTISEAVQASTALPGFYKPARIKGVDYVDGSVRRTANLDVAVEHGADLIICYNPFRPFSNRVRRRFDRETGEYRYEGPLLADGGALSVLNQVFRTLLHSRLQYGLRQYQDDPSFRGDIIVIEPRETDIHFFELNALAYWERLRAARLGYVSVSESIDRHYEPVKAILERYGLTMTRRQVRQSMERMRDDDGPMVSDALTRDIPKRRLRVA